MDTYEKEIFTQVYGEKNVEFLENVENKIEEAMDRANEISRDNESAKTTKERRYLKSSFKDNELCQGANKWFKRIILD